MTDVLTLEQRKRCMASVHSQGTAIERKVRRLLHRAGFRFRVNRKTLPGCPDIVLPKYHRAVFVHGCFWHGHSCGKGRLPTTNREFWQAKITRNIERDKENEAALRELGWTVTVIWECDLKTGVEELIRDLEKMRGNRS